MDLPAGYELRAPGRDELEAVSKVVIADELYSTGHVTLGADFVRSAWNQDDFDLSTDAWVIVDGDLTVIGYGQVRLEEPEMAVSWDAIHPDHRGKGIGSALFARIESRAAAMLSAQESGAHRHAIYAGDEESASCLRDRGLQLVRHFWHMEIEITPPFKTGPLPAGVEVRGIHPVDGPRIAYEVINEALADNWDYHPVPFEKWIADERATPGYDPSLWLLAVHEEKPIGAITLSIGEDRGWVDYLGVLAAYRGKGVAVALLHRAFAVFADSGVRRALVSVDANNATRATAVYERAGMRQVKAWDTWQHDWPWPAAQVDGKSR